MATKIKPESDEVARERIRSRTEAEAYYEMIVEAVDGFSCEEFRRRFLSLLVYRIEEYAGNIDDSPPIKKVDPLPTQYRPMDDAEAKRFEQQLMPFGKFKDRPVADADLEYLRWVDSDEFKWKLHRYLKSQRVSLEEQE